MAHSWLCFIGYSLGRPFLTPAFLIPVPYLTTQPCSTVLRSTHNGLTLYWCSGSFCLPPLGMQALRAACVCLLHLRKFTFWAQAVCDN